MKTYYSDEVPEGTFYLLNPNYIEMRSEVSWKKLRRHFFWWKVRHPFSRRKAKLLWTGELKVKTK